MIKPLILSPAGSYKALVAAVNAGADEVYFGFGEFNARYNAKNFTKEEMAQAIRMCRILGVKTNITLNTLVTDKEIDRVCDMVYEAHNMGADAFIVQDIGLAKIIKARMPQVTLHASTQCACHNLSGAKKLIEVGFSRVVLAREMPKEEIKKIIDMGIETEIFVHGALCVCHSGMCLMSSVIGKRSGNRGLCAQPCRLPYKLSDSHTKNINPLSLKDLSLAQKVEDILDMGVTSLKIEGRMKSPDYVYDTTKIWREIVDGGKNANREQVKRLQDVFTRGGFTDKYFTGEYLNNNIDMYGVRSDKDKQNSRMVNNQDCGDTCNRKRNIKLYADIVEGQRAKLTAFCDEFCVTVESDFDCPCAKDAPINEESVKESLLKLGNTYFCANKQDVEVSITGNVFLSKSMLNSLRRETVDALEEKLCENTQTQILPVEKTKGEKQQRNATQIFALCKNLNSAVGFKYAKYISVPLETFIKPDENIKQQIHTIGDNCQEFGVTMPRVLFDEETEGCSKALDMAKQMGAKFALVSNIGHIDIVKKAGLSLFGGIGLNAFNSLTLDYFKDENFQLVTVSPELNEAQIRDIERFEGVELCAFAKGRLPLMVLESCIVKANGKCQNKNADCCTVLTDRIGKQFSVCGERRFCEDNTKPCRNIIYNSVEADILSKQEKMAKMNVDVAMVLV